MSATEEVELIASFSPTSRSFAFKAKGSQTNFVDLYPLDSTNEYKVNSSLVNRIDYEATDLQISDSKFLSWCCAKTDESATKVKRKRGSDGDDYTTNTEEQDDPQWEDSLVNTFSKGKIVVFSPNGQDIVNIIQNKHEILGLDTSGTSIWLLDEDHAVKHFLYNSNKPLKTFHLTDGKNEKVFNFELLQFSTVMYLAVSTEDSVYIIDPSKRRPRTVAKLDVFGTLSCKVLDDDHVVVATFDSISVVNIKTQSMAMTWKAQAEKIIISDALVFALEASGTVSVFKLGNQKALSTISIKSHDVVDCSRNCDGSILLAWVNVNEPQFEVVKLQKIATTPSIVLDKETISPHSTKKTHSVPTPQPLEENTKTIKKITKSEQEKLNQGLTDALALQANDDVVMDILSSLKWSETKIKEFVMKNLPHEACDRVYSLLSKELANDIWSARLQLQWWLKWLFTLKGTEIEAIESGNKDTKHLKATLKSCRDVFPVLLSIQGALEMLKAQAKLRQEFAQLSLNAEDTVPGELADETDVVYINGEGDDFIDALQ